MLQFSETEMLPYAHALLDLHADGPRREKLGLALVDAHEALERGNLGLVTLHELESVIELLKLKQ